MLQPSNDRITAALIVSPKGTQHEKAQDASSGSRGAYQRNDFKEDVVWIYKGILPGHKKEWNDAICKNMNGPRDDQTKWSKSDKDKYDIAYTQNLKKKNDTNELIYKQKQIHRLQKQIYSYQRGNRARWG